MKTFWEGEGVSYSAWQRIERHLHGQGEKIKDEDIGNVVIMCSVRGLLSVRCISLV